MSESETIDAKVAASEARLRGESNEKFAEIRGEMKLMSTDLSNKLDKVLSKIDDFDKRLSGFDKKLGEQRSEIKADLRAYRTLMIGLAVSVSGLMLAVVIAVFSVGGTMFSRGMQIRDVVKAVHAEFQAMQPITGKR